MSTGHLLTDRLTGRLVAVPQGQVLLGRYAVPPGARYVLAGRPAEPGSYLAGSTQGWVLSATGGQAWWTGGFGRQPFPTSLVVDNVLAAARGIGELIGRQAGLLEFLRLSPLVTDADRRLEPHPLDRHITSEFAHLHKVCREPHARLRTEQVEVPVGMARRITWRTVVHLAAHSETWAAHRLHGVEPARLLTPVPAADHDFYENHVVASLLRHLWQHVQARAAELNSIERLVSRAGDFLKQAGERSGYRERQRLYGLIEDLATSTTAIENLIRELERAEELQNAVVRLLPQKLPKTVRTPYSGPLQRRPTNLFIDNADYRGCGRLWDAWVALGRRADAETDDAIAGQWCSAFTRYLVLITVRALDQLGKAGDADARPGSPDAERTAPRFAYRGRAVELRWPADDTLTISVDTRNVLRIVPLAHALTRSGDPDSVAGWLAALSAGAEGSPRTAVAYPGETGERERLPLPLRLALHDSYGGDHVGFPVPALVPVSPLDIDSVGRVARLLRSAIDDPAAQSYPPRVPCDVEGVAPVAEAARWLAASPGELTVLRPPRPQELAETVSALAKIRTAAVHPRQRQRHSERVADLVAGLQVACDDLAKLTTCPVCQRAAAQPDRAMKLRDNLTYQCDCEWCHTSWETRLCRCGNRYLVLQAAGLENNVGGDGDHLDRVFAQDLLATPCWVRTRSHICPACGRCSKSDAPDVVAACHRCGNSRGNAFGM